jgi:hypothetical protein
VADSGDLPEGWEVAGWEDKDGNWQNTEQGDPEPTGDDLVDSYQTVVSHRDEDGKVHYYTVSGGVDEWEGLLDAIEDLEDIYG